MFDHLLKHNVIVHLSSAGDPSSFFPPSNNIHLQCAQRRPGSLHDVICINPENNNTHVQHSPTDVIYIQTAEAERQKKKKLSVRI